MDTSNFVKEFRKKTKLSQSDFAKRFNVPLSTLRKWEQKETNPSKYFVELLLNLDSNKDFYTISNNKYYYQYDKRNMIVYNNKGIGLKIDFDITKSNKDNLIIMLNGLFDDYKKIVNKFNTLCKIDAEGNSKWIELK